MLSLLGKLHVTSFNSDLAFYDSHRVNKNSVAWETADSEKCWAVPPMWRCFSFITSFALKNFEESESLLTYLMWQVSGSERMQSLDSQLCSVSVPKYQWADVTVALLQITHHRQSGFTRTFTALSLRIVWLCPTRQHHSLIPQAPFLPPISCQYVKKNDLIFTKMIAFWWDMNNLLYSNRLHFPTVSDFAVC